MKRISGPMTLLHIVAGIAAFFAAQFASMAAYFIPIDPLVYPLSAAIQIGGVVLFVSIYSRKVLHLTLADLRVKRPVIVPVWLACAVALPVLVSLFFLLFVPGTFVMGDISGYARAMRVLMSVCGACLSAGITEELLFRGYIMKLVEGKWGRLWSILAPSMVFGLLHLIGMEQPNLVDILALFVAGTAVGVMFSLITYRTGSIWPAAIVHGLWNLIMIGGILRIGVESYSLEILSYLLTSSNTLLTGGAFGVEASLPAIVGYLLVIALALLLPEKRRVQH